MMTDDEIIQVVQARKEGKTIEVRTRAELEDWHVTTHPTWNFFELEYRVSLEPRIPREWWVHKECPGGYTHAAAIAHPINHTGQTEDYVRVREVIEENKAMKEAIKDHSLK